MPRRNVGAYSQLRQHAKKLLAGLGSEIRLKKAELARLETEYAQLVGIAGSRVAASVSRVAKPASRSAGRIDWRQILAKLPKEFKAADIRQVRGMKAKRPSELFAGVTRWIDSGAVKKKKRGVYLRLK